MESKHTVFEGVLVGILLAPTLLENQPHAKTVLIALDNQAAIQLCPASLIHPQ